MPNQSSVKPFVAGAVPAQIQAILGAMRAVAETDKPLSDADRRALSSANLYLFGQTSPVDFEKLKPVAPGDLASSLASPALREDVLKFITVMAFIDGTLDKAKIGNVLRFAKALGLHERYIDEVAEAAQGHVQEALADMTRANMESITGRQWTGDAKRWFMPYSGAADPALAKRLETLASLGADTFGHAFYDHYRSNNYDFPGQPKGLNVAFALPHDTVHVVSGYGTTPRGELLTSTFTAAMHPHFPMAGHVLPVIFSWHLNVQINAVAGDAKGALDPDEFWHAWAAGAAAKVDTFAPGWDFWSFVQTPLRQLRKQWSISEAGLDPHAA